MAALPLVKRSDDVPVDKSSIQLAEEQRWLNLIGDLVAGMPVSESLSRNGYNRVSLEALLRIHPERVKQWSDARLAAQRAEYPIELIEEIFADIAGGMAPSNAIKNRGKRMETFNRIILAEPVLYDLYEKACQARTLVLADETIAISDNKDDDVDLFGKGNVAAVNRSRLQVETRTKTMQSWFSRVYGTQGSKVEVNVQINHAERLEAARRRRDTGRPAVQVDVRPVATDAPFQPVIKATREPAPEPIKVFAGEYDPERPRKEKTARTLQETHRAAVTAKDVQKPMPLDEDWLTI